jgi:hypothetical protein
MTIGASTFSFNSEPASGPVKTKTRNVVLVAGIRGCRVITLPSFLAVWILAFTSSAAFGVDAEIKEALRLIDETAGQICQTAPLEQHNTGTELSGEAKAKVGGIIGKLAGLGFEGAAEYQSGDSAGVLQKDLIEAIQIGNKCKQHVFDTLVGILLKEPSNNATHGVPDPVIKKNAQDMRLEHDIIGTWRYSTKRIPSTGLTDCVIFTTFQPDHIANQRSSCIYQGQRYPGEGSGKWSITSGVLRCKMESYNIASQFQLKGGFSWEGKIIRVTNDKLTQINLTDGKTQVSFRLGH